MVSTLPLLLEETTTVEVAAVELAGVVTGQTVVLTATDWVVVKVELEETNVEQEVA